MQARELQVNGIVQGVGFRPHVARLARALGCTGWVLNSAHGVTIHVEADDAARLGQFEQKLVEMAPPAVKILKLDANDVEPEGLAEFSIRASVHDDAKSTLISPDLATCDECVHELFDPHDRRYHYPFINCTNCGPRFTIIEDLPYDRPVTSMRAFEMCPECAAEYADDDDRRYHAQPNACFTCGPRLWLCEAGALPSFDSAYLTRNESDALIEQTARRLDAGDICAIKGLGGWHLACDASNEAAVRKLRERKHRPSKPLAIMVQDLVAARRLAQVGDEEAALLESHIRPIVLLERRENIPLAQSVAKDLPEVGIMLPATPVQHLLLRACSKPLVMTSGNRSGEPIVASDEDALEMLGGIADFYLGNNRAIVARYDDSVVRVTDDKRTQMVRRARGYAPMPLLLSKRARQVEESSNWLTRSSTQNPSTPALHACARDNAKASTRAIFAAGPEQKATFATLSGERVYISQHLGDLERLGAWQAWEQARSTYERLFDIRPHVIACDMHPDYLASKWARAFAAENGLPLIEVQHHHAHIASVLGETETFEPVIGIALDGTGYGTDETIWGGEILIATRADFERFWHLPSFQLPGATAAIHHPERTAYALLRAYGELDNPQFAPFLEQLENRELLDQMMTKSINSPVCSSAGRLFDGVAALLGVCTQPSYDGEAACLLEAAALRDNTASSSRAPLTAWSFHERLINAIIEQALNARAESGLQKIAMSGGCMVNRIILTQLRKRLEEHGFDVLLNRRLPPNDGCIAYGQAIVAAARLEE